MKKTFSIVAAMVLFAACHGHRETVTGDYGNGVVSGQIVMATGMTNASPAGVRVAVRGTGMSAVVGADGRFAFAGVGEGAELIFERQSDGVSARLSLASTSAPVVVELGQSTATVSRQRAAPSTPVTKLEGTITAVSATSLTVHDSQGDHVLSIAEKTVIRKGSAVLKPSDLAVGMHVYVAVDGNTALYVYVVDEKSEHDDATAIGKVKSVGSDNLVLTTANGDVTVKVDANTVIHKNGAVVHLGDVSVGDEGGALGTRIDEHTLLAKQIELKSATPPPPQIASAYGTVKSVGSDNLVLTTSNGDVTVKVDASTVIRKDGAAAHLGDIKAGDYAGAYGTRVDEHTLLAKQIEAKSPPQQTASAYGTVKSVGSDNLVITTSNGDVTVKVDASTVIRKDGAAAHLADIKAGDYAGAYGTRVDEHTLLAKQVEAKSATPPPPQIASAYGTVKSVGSDNLVITTSNGDVTVKADASTVIRKDGAAAHLADIKAGDYAGAYGTRVDEHTILAKQIEVKSK